MKRLLFVAVVLFAACGDHGSPSTPLAPDADPNDPLPPPAPGEGVQFRYGTVAPAGSEIWKCLVAPVPGVTGGGFLDFNRVESKQSTGVHHMDLSILTMEDIPDGEYDCRELYDAHPQLMDETILYASQHAEQSLTLPPGTVAEVPAAIHTMLELHFVNGTDQDLPVWARINAYTIPGSQVTQTIWGEAIRDRNLDIPAGGDDDEWTRCVMDEDVDVLVLSTHTHALGHETDVYRFDGQKRGELLYTNLDWSTPLLMDLTAAPLHVPKGQGFEFHCKYENPGATDVHWGFTSKDEMCNLALVFTPGQAIACNPVATSDGLGVGP
jgi:hypothetical protein